MLNYVKTAIFAQFNDTANQKPDYPDCIQPKDESPIKPQEKQNCSLFFTIKIVETYDRVSSDNFKR